MDELKLWELEDDMIIAAYTREGAIRVYCGFCEIDKETFDKWVQEEAVTHPNDMEPLDTLALTNRNVTINDKSCSFADYLATMSEEQVFIMGW